MSHDEKGPENSDTESLPDISQIITAPPVDKEVSKGDIVWAKFKNLYWPALVRAVYRKEKKISIWYTDDPGKTFKLPLKNIRSFHDTEMRIKIERDVREAGCVQEHEGLTSHALRYLRRKAEGYVDDPMKYFDQTYPFFLVEELLKNDPNADVSGIKIPPLYLSHEKKSSIRKSLNVQKATTSLVESDIESVCSTDESNDDDVRNEDISKVEEKFSSVSCEDENTCKIVNIITSGKADDYLQKILLKRIPSQHRDLYEREIKCGKKSTTSLTYTGPIDDDKKMRELIFYLLPLYASMTSIRRSKRNSSRKFKVKVLKYSSVDKNVGAQYVASVWLPEAIIYAISQVYDVSLTDAKQLFQKRSVTKDIENILSSVGSEAIASDSEIIMHDTTGDKQDDNKTEICSPVKKLCVRRRKR